jgi:hypothetical protein
MAKLMTLEIFTLLTKYNQNNQVKDKEMGRVCSTHGREVHAGV